MEYSGKEIILAAGGGQNGLKGDYVFFQRSVTVTASLNLTQIDLLSCPFLL